MAESGWIASDGPVSKEFKKRFRKFIGEEQLNLSLCSNGTSALYLSLLALGVEKDDEIVIPTYTCSALLNAINLIGATPRLVDVCEETLAPSLEQYKSAISDKTKAIILVHPHGLPIKVSDYKSLNLPIIEDCCLAIGSKDIGLEGDLSVFSFHATKYITGGSGGLIATKNKSLHHFIEDYLDFDGVESYKPRFNFHLSDLNVALIDKQLARFTDIHNRKKEIFSKLQSAVPLVSYGESDSYNHYRFLIRLKTKQDACSLIEYLKENEVAAIKPIESFELLHNYLKLDGKNYPTSEELAKTIVSLPAHSKISAEELKYLIKILKEYSWPIS